METMRNINSTVYRAILWINEALVTLLYMAGYAIRDLYRAIAR